LGCKKKKEIRSSLQNHPPAAGRPEAGWALTGGCCGPPQLPTSQRGPPPEIRVGNYFLKAGGIKQPCFWWWVGSGFSKRPSHTTGRILRIHHAVPQEVFGDDVMSTHRHGTEVFRVEILGSKSKSYYFKFKARLILIVTSWWFQPI